MREQSDPIDALVAGYTSGTLPGPLSAIVEAHLWMSPANRTFAADMELMSAMEMEAIEPVALADANAVLARILEGPDEPIASNNTAALANGQTNASAWLPQPIARLVGRDIDEIPWRMALPGVREYKIGDADGCRMSMFWLKAGKGVPTHTHGGAEVTLVLEGGYTDGHGHYVAGDLAYADDSVDHRPVADDDGDCIGFAITDAPLVLTGPVGRFFNPLFRG